VKRVTTATWKARFWSRIRTAFALLFCAIAGLRYCSAKTEIEVDVFQGAFGVDFFEDCAKSYEKEHPDVKVTVHGHPRIQEQLTPRFAAGNPPDLAWPGFGMNLWGLVANGQLLPWDKYLVQPGFEPGKTWGDSFLPDLLAKGSLKGKHYILPSTSGAFGWWYNKGMFREHGWTPPKTWDELLPLCEKIKKTGISPLTFTGRYPMYLLRGIYFPFLVSKDGLESMDRIQNLEPGAWLNPAAEFAAERMMELKHRGYFEPGCIGMNHTESQMEFLVNHVAMIPNGTWLHSEMAKLLPPSFKMEYINCPVFADGKGDPSIVLMWVDGRWVLPTKGKHPDIAADFFKYMCEPSRARKFMESKGTMMGFRVPGEINMPDYLKEAVRLQNAASQTWTYEIPEWYPSLSTEYDEATRDLYNEVITPAEFVQRNEASNKVIRENPAIRKFKIEK
jgi:N-acetylglucosamine transport system substrate-binding protein